ncbi:hypothetical protein C0J56_03725 [Pseudomonas fluorescens]|nr:hypothetical protein C0J56_03725 [Pseudomonas fluorescens]
MGASLLAIAVGQLASILNVPPSSRACSLPKGSVQSGETGDDRILEHGHKFRVNIGHRAGYCRELDSH